MLRCYGCYGWKPLFSMVAVVNKAQVITDYNAL